MGIRGWRLLTLLLVLGPPSPGTTLAGVWAFDEPAEERTAADLGPESLAGTVGHGVMTGAVASGATGYRFPDVAPNDPPVRPEHLVTIDDHPRLDPDDGVFAVTLRFRTTSSPSNIAQKGQHDSGGGYWKVEQDDGIVSCLFLDGGGRGVTASSTRRVDDGAWHTVLCRRTPDDVTLYVDCVRTAHVSGTTGRIANTSPLTIGGKSRCDQKWVGCDYFSGDVDVVRIEKE
jgi:hypothetical protein